MSRPEDVTSETAQTVSAGQLRAFVERIERLEEEQKAMAAEAGCGLADLAEKLLTAIVEDDRAAHDGREAA